MLLNTDDLPEDPLEQIMWLSGVKERVASELDDLLAEAYFQARVTGRFEDALRNGGHSRKRALRWTRRVNESRGRQVRWGDGL